MTKTMFGARTTGDEIVQGVDLTGRTMMVTGATAGIGFETARALAKAGAHVYLACRDPESGAACVAAIQRQHPGAQASVAPLDLASFASVRRCAADLPAVKLDALVCNAGVYLPDFGLTEDGIERTVGVCHFGHFLLTLSLLDRLQAASASRVVMVSSESHRHPARLSFDRFPLPKDRYRALVAYGQAKLANVLFANELTRRFAAQGVVANALHPGAFIGTSIFRHSVPAKALAAVLRPFTKTLAQGAATSVYCAVAPELAGVGGEYFLDCRRHRATSEARSEPVARRLWDLTAERVGLTT